MEELLSQFHKELRLETQMQGFLVEKTKHVIRHISQYGEKGFISFSNVNEENARGVIKQELNYFKELNQEFEWKVYSYDKPDSLRDMLEQEGFTIDSPEALMVMKIDEEHSFLANGAYDIVKEITDEKGIKEIIALEEAIWNESQAELGERLWRDKQNDPTSLYLYGIYEDSQLVSAAWMYLETNSSFASLWGGSTLPLYRGRGYYSKLLAVRAQKAFESGHLYLTVDASPMSKPILEKHGFSCLAYSYGCQSPSFT